MLIRFVLQPQRQPQPQPPQSQSEHEQQKTESGEPETLQLLKRSTSTSVYVCVYECKLRNEYEGSELMPHNFFRFFCITQLNFYCHLIMKMTTTACTFVCSQMKRNICKHSEIQTRVNSAALLSVVGFV